MNPLTRDVYRSLLRLGRHFDVDTRLKALLAVPPPCEGCARQMCTPETCSLDHLRPIRPLLTLFLRGSSYRPSSSSSLRAFIRTEFRKRSGAGLALAFSALRFLSEHKQSLSCLPKPIKAKTKKVEWLASWQHTEKLRVGDILLANATQQGRYARGVFLMLKRTQPSSVGVLLNHPSSLALANVAPLLGLESELGELAHNRVFHGGPDETPLLAIHNQPLSSTNHPLSSPRRLSKSANKRLRGRKARAGKLKVSRVDKRFIARAISLIRENKAKSSDFKFVIGCRSWGRELNEEWKENDWYAASGSPSELMRVSLAQTPIISDSPLACETKAKIQQLMTRSKREKDLTSALRRQLEGLLQAAHRLNTRKPRRPMLREAYAQPKQLLLPSGEQETTSEVEHTGEIIDNSDRIGRGHEARSAAYTQASTVVVRPREAWPEEESPNQQEQAWQMLTLLNDVGGPSLTHRTLANKNLSNRLHFSGLTPLMAAVQHKLQRCEKIVHLLKSPDTNEPPRLPRTPAESLSLFHKCFVGTQQAGCEDALWASVLQGMGGDYAGIAALGPRSELELFDPHSARRASEEESEPPWLWMTQLFEDPEEMEVDFDNQVVFLDFDGDDNA